MPIRVLCRKLGEKEGDPHDKQDQEDTNEVDQHALSSFLCINRGGDGPEGLLQVAQESSSHGQAQDGRAKVLVEGQQDGSDLWGKLGEEEC